MRKESKSSIIHSIHTLNTGTLACNKIYINDTGTEYISRARRIRINMLCSLFIKRARDHKYSIAPLHIRRISRATFHCLVWDTCENKIIDGRN